MKDLEDILKDRTIAVRASTKKFVKKLWLVWAVLIIVCGVITAIVAIIAENHATVLWVALAVCVVTIVFSYNGVRPGETYVAHIFWTNMYAVEPGAYMLPFPIAGFRRKFLTGANSLTIAPNGNMDFSDASANVDADFFFYVVDFIKAVVNVVDFKSSIQKKSYALVASLFGGVKVLEASKNRAEYTLPKIIAIAENGISLENSDFYKELFDHWGIYPSAIVIGDISLDKEDVINRRQLLDAENREKVARKNKNIAILAGEGEAGAIAVVSRALLNQISDLVRHGKLNTETATLFINNMKKWDSLGDKAVVIDSDHGGGSGNMANFVALKQLLDNLK